MAYDAKDPADKKILDDAVAAALAEAEAEHEAATTGLKTKNAQLIEKLKMGGEGDPAEVARLEGEIETLNKSLKDTNKALTTAQKAAKEATEAFESESGVTRKLLVDNGLTEALISNNVAKQFLPAV